MPIHVALSSSDQLPLRSARRALSARHPAAARAALPHADPELLAEGRAAASTSSTGSRIPTATTSRGSCSPTRREQLLIDVDLTAELSVFNPFDFFLEPSAETFPFAYEPGLSQELAPYLEQLPAGPRLRDCLGAIDRRPVRTIDFLVDLNRRLAQDISYIIRLEPGVQTPEETLATRKRLVPRHRLAARADPASSRTGGAIRLRIPDSAHARCEVAGWPDRSQSGLHRPARLGGGLSPGSRLGGARPDLRPPGRRRPHPARCDTRTCERRAGHRRRGRHARRSSSTR